MFDSLKITTSYLSFLLFLVHRTVLLNVKNFRESYVFHCLVIKVSVSRQLHQITTSSNTCQQLFSSFLRFFSTTYAVFCGFCHLSLTTRLLYHMFSHLSTTIFIFLKNHQIVSFKKAILSDSSVRIPQETMHVNIFFHFILFYSICLRVFL